MAGCIIRQQVRLRAAVDRQRECRGRVARAVAGWQQATGERYTPEQAARDFIASSIADRAAANDGRVGRRSTNQPGPSVVDRMAFGHGRNINVGRYGAWRRGAKNIHDLGR